MSIKTGTILVLVVFVGTLVYQVVNRLSSEALSVAVGVLFGMVASVPVSLGLLIALTRRREQSEDDDSDEHSSPTPHAEVRRQTEQRREYDSPRPEPGRVQQPQVIVIAPPQGQNSNGYTSWPLPGQHTSNYQEYAALREDVIEAREWKIIGDEA